MDEKSGKSRSFEEITLAITILTGLSFILFKIADYFNNNIVRYSLDVQLMIYFLVMGLLIEITIISSFLILKGYEISLGKKENSSIYGTNWLFKFIFKGLIGLSAFSVSLLFLIVIYNIFKLYDIFKNTTISTIGSVISYSIMVYFLYQVSNLSGVNRKFFFDYMKKFLEFKHIGIFTIVFIVYLMAPTYFLMGSYSIDVFPQSNANGDILTFTVKETGSSFNHTYIDLYKLNSSSDFLWFVDNVTLYNNKEALSNNTFMLGGNYNGVWYLNINTSKLHPGNYLLHAEITDDFFKIFLGGENSKKQADKLFYIPPKKTNCSFDSK